MTTYADKIKSQITQLTDFLLLNDDRFVAIINRLREPRNVFYYY